MAADVGVRLELQYDGRDDSEPVLLADNDLFAGVRLALNDTQDTAVLAGVGYDLDTSETRSTSKPTAASAKTMCWNYERGF